MSKSEARTTAVQCSCADRSKRRRPLTSAQIQPPRCSSRKSTGSTRQRRTCSCSQPLPFHPRSPRSARFEPGCWQLEQNWELRRHRTVSGWCETEFSNSVATARLAAGANRIGNSVATARLSAGAELMPAGLLARCSSVGLRNGSGDCHAQVLGDRFRHATRANGWCLACGGGGRAVAVGVIKLSYDRRIVCRLLSDARCSC